MHRSRSPPGYVVPTVGGCPDENREEVRHGHTGGDDLGVLRSGREPHRPGCRRPPRHPVRRPRHSGGRRQGPGRPPRPSAGPRPATAQRHHPDPVEDGQLDRSVRHDARGWPGRDRRGGRVPGRYREGDPLGVRHLRRGDTRARRGGRPVRPSERPPRALARTQTGPAGPGHGQPRPDPRRGGQAARGDRPGPHRLREALLQAGPAGSAPLPPRDRHDGAVRRRHHRPHRHRRAPAPASTNRRRAGRRGSRRRPAGRAGRGRNSRRG